MAWDELSESEKGYIAGFIDGEGSILLVRHNTKACKLNVRPIISIYNTDRKVMDWISTAIGGDLIERSKDKRRDPLHTKPCYAISIRRYPEVYGLLLSIRKYLKIKQINADIVIRFCEEILMRENRHYTEDQIEASEEYYSKLKAITSNGGDKL